MQAIIDASRIETRGDLHDALARTLELPLWYGRNLDALYDCLTDLHRDTEIVLRNAALLDERLGAYAGVFRTVLREACEDNAHLRLTLDEAPCAGEE